MTRLPTPYILKPKPKLTHKDVRNVFTPDFISIFLHTRLDMWATWRIHMIQIYVRHDSFICGCMCEMTLSYAWQDSFVFVPNFISTFLHTRLDTCVIWLIHMQIHVRNDTFIFVTRLICIRAQLHFHIPPYAPRYMCDMTHSYVDTCATWLIHTRDKTHSYSCPIAYPYSIARLDMCATWRIHMQIHARHDSFICGCMCDMTLSSLW